MAELDYIQSSKAISDAFRDIISQISLTVNAANAEDKLFPGGISFINFTLKIPPSVEFGITISGDKPKSPASGTVGVTDRMESSLADISKVQFDLYDGGGDIKSWIEEACSSCGIVFNDLWLKGMETLCRRESSFKPNSVNTTDSNATGPIVGDGNKQNCSRGVAQCIPSTFSTFHCDGTSWEIYNPVANIAAAMNYNVTLSRR